MVDLEPYIFVFVLSAPLAIPLGITLRTLLAMKERVVVPLLRIRMATGEVRAITYQRKSCLHQPVSRFRQYVPVIPVQIIHRIPPRRES